MNKESKIFVAGHNGMVGSAIVRKLKDQSYTKLQLKNHKQLDLENQKDTESFFKNEKPEYVFLAAANVGGIEANRTAPADFYYRNAMISNNVIHCSYRHNVKKLLFLGSSCIYPQKCLQPIKEEYLLTGSLEQTNEGYAIAKISGLKMCQYYKQQYGCNFISVMPTNLYGPNDNFDLTTSHVLPALIRKFIDAKESGSKEVLVWGTGKPLREFLHVDDLADACVFLMNNYNGIDHVNVGTGSDMTISQLANMIKEVTGFKGDIVFDDTKPDGTYRKLLDVSKINKLGWSSKIDLYNGIEDTIKWYEKSRS